MWLRLDDILTDYPWLWAKAQAAGKVNRAAVKASLHGLLKQMEGRS